MSLRSRTRAVVSAVAVATVVSFAGACTTSGPDPVALTGPAPVPTSAPDAALSRFYDQKLTWQACATFECANLRVPIDYAKPADGEIGIKVLRVKARDQSRRLGSLVVNPGGPGGSGVNYAANADAIVGDPVRRYYDVVGFDPRGVGRSAPVDCLSDRQLDTFLGTDPTPDDKAEEQQLLVEAKDLAAGCEQKNAKLLPHLSTVDAAKDMDVLRATIGDPQLNYLGKSYGTFLGSTYAGLFPKRVGRFVLDGVVPPDLTSAELGQGQAQGFELATRAYVQSCVDSGDCILGDSVDEGMQWIRTFLKGLDAKPLPSGDSAVPELNEAWASLGFAGAMYDEGSWGSLTDAIAAAKAGSGAGLMKLADQYAYRAPGGNYTNNLLEVIYAVNCLDRPDSPDLSTYEQYAKDFAQTAPTWGAFLAWGALPCGVWPVKGGEPPHTISAEGSNTIVVVGTTRDPATIYEWSKRLRDQLSNAVLISRDGDGHTAYRRGNACVDSAIDSYYVQGITPKDGLKC
ncbi:MAG: alpha/beta hydrolase [Terracoccus sp.]